MDTTKVVQTSERDTTLDTVKALLIFAIYYFHYGTAGGDLYLFFSNYHVPAFFMVSGFWALNKINRSIAEQVTVYLSKYIYLWFCWICVYTICYSIINNYSFNEAIALFFDYIYSYRGSGIGGIWFIPAFFIVSTIYFILIKLSTKLIDLTPLKLSALLCGIIFIFYFLFRYVIPHSSGWIFSTDFVPQYLFYYAFGTFLYTLYKHLNSTTFSHKKLLLIFVITISVTYTILTYYKIDTVIWNIINTHLQINCLSIISDTLIVVFALITNICIARIISCKLTVDLGKATLGLCLAESFVKQSILVIFNIIGFDIVIDTPLKVFIATLAALVIACYLVLPIANKFFESVRRIIYEKK